MTRARAGRALVCGGLVGVVVGVGTVSALAQATDEVLHGCAQQHSGALRLLGQEESCRTGERAVQWHVRGPQGATGPQGEPGPPGPPGPEAEPDWFLSCQDALEECARRAVSG